LSDKMGEEPVFTPSQFIDYIARTRNLKSIPLQIPPRLVMVYDLSNFKYLQKITKSKAIKWWYSGQRPLQIGHYGHTPVALICNLIGAPAACMVLEEVIATGAKEIIEVGIAGGIQPYLKPGDILVITGAERDEGTSYHYYPPGVEFECSPRLRKRIENCFDRKNMKYYRGSIWTTDGVYRETKVKLRKFREEGILGVNMETSALLAVARYRGAKLASIQVVSDILSESSWLLATHYAEVRSSIRNAMNCALEVLCSH